MGMKLSISLTDTDVDFLDQVADERGVGSRSAVVQLALRVLRERDLESAYAAAWSEWDDSDQDLWDATSGDGLG
ncbi:MAG: ribbon-helix-helix domain-containing protein [Microthrixaceae bacterium]